MNTTNNNFRNTQDTLNNHHLAIKMLDMSFTMYTKTGRKYIDFYSHYERSFEDFLSSLDVLANGRLTHRILDPPTLARYLRTIENDLARWAPYFELVFQNLFEYYAEPLISFTNSADQLLVQIPILLKHKTQLPMSLYSVETVPVPLDALTHQGKNHDYTLVDTVYPYVAMAPNTYVPLTNHQLQLCTLMGHTYLCETAHLLHDKTQHTCASAIYYKVKDTDAAKVCKTEYLKNTHPEPKVLVHICFCPIYHNHGH
jgi:hypothetical protein